MNLPINDITAQHILMARSPYYVVADYITPYDSIEVTLYVWRGLREDFIRARQYRLRKHKLVSNDGAYGISFNISPYILPNIGMDFGIKMLYDPRNFGCWFCFETRYIKDGSTVKTNESALYYGLSGFKWGYEPVQIGMTPNKLYDGTTDDTFNNPTTSSKYHNYVKLNPLNADYLTYSIDPKALDSNKVIVYKPLAVPTENIKCSQQSFIITYIGKSGTFDQLTTFGKSVLQSNYSSDKYHISPFNQNNFNTEFQTTTGLIDINLDTTYNLNTGYLNPKLSNKIMELISSPFIWLYDVNNDITIPVIYDGSGETFKTILNDKNKTSYNLRFKTNSNIRKEM